MFGKDCIKRDSQTQDTTALSSGGIVNAAALVLAAEGLLNNMEANVEVQVRADSSPAESVAF